MSASEIPRPANALGAGLTSRRLGDGDTVLNDRFERSRCRRGVLGGVLWESDAASDVTETDGTGTGRGAKGFAAVDEIDMRFEEEAIEDATGAFAGTSSPPPGAGTRIMRPSGPRTKLKPLASALVFFARRFFAGVAADKVGEAGFGDEGAV